ncbi:MAG: hypothetical protein EBV28_13795 [Betaproteobacteria bacterium]|nr:hypothetical protein [Betaproteobacteria bacterium]
METFLLQVISGIATGGIYASVALALVMIYQSTHHINFAQGEMAMFATYLSWSMIQAGFNYWVAFFGTIALAFVIGVVIQRVVIRPVERPSSVASAARCRTPSTPCTGCSGSSCCACFALSGVRAIPPPSSPARSC